MKGRVFQEQENEIMNLKELATERNKKNTRINSGGNRRGIYVFRRPSK